MTGVSDIRSFLVVWNKQIKKQRLLTFFEGTRVSMRKAGQHQQNED